MISNRFLKMTGALCLRLFRMIRALCRGLWRWIVFPSLIFVSLYYTCSFLFSEMMTRSFEFYEKDQAAIYGMTPNEYKEIRFMEIEEYLRELHYYDGPLTGKVTLGFLSAVYDFSKDQKIPDNAPFLSMFFYSKLRAMYWMALGPWPDPEVSFFYADDKKIMARGGWEDHPSQKLYPYLSSNIWCVIEEGLCTESIRFDFRDTEDQLSTDLGTQPHSQSSMLFKYRITKHDKDQIVAETALIDADMRVKGLPKQQWTVDPDEGKIYLNIDIPSHTILKTIAADKSPNLGSDSEKILSVRKLIDPGAGLFALRYESLRNRRVVNRAESASYDRLLQWMKLRDLSEYKKLRAGRNNNFLLSDLPQNTTFSFLDSGD